MDNIEFNKRLVNILKVRNKLTRSELVYLLQNFWKINKKNLQVIYHYHCYKVITGLLKHFDTIIEESNRRYYYVYRDVLIKYVTDIK